MRYKFIIPLGGISKERVDESIAKLVSNYSDEVDWNGDILSGDILPEYIIEGEYCIWFMDNIKQIREINV